MINVVCVLKSGPAWLPEYVYKLRDMISRNLRTPYQFVCLSDVELDVDKNIQLWPLVSTNRVPPFWYKMQLFRPDIQWQHPVLFFDLDVVIKGDITDMIETFYKHDFAMIQSPFRENQSNSSFMWWQGDYSWLWQIFQRRTVFEWQLRYNDPGAGGKYGDQGFIADHVYHQRIQDLIEPQRIAKVGKRETGEWCDVVVFAGKRKPWQMTDHPDVIKHWLTNKEYYDNQHHTVQ
jgi:hypothetical protein